MNKINRYKIPLLFTLYYFLYIVSAIEIIFDSAYYTYFLALRGICVGIIFILVIKKNLSTKKYLLIPMLLWLIINIFYIDQALFLDNLLLFLLVSVMLSLDENNKEKILTFLFYFLLFALVIFVFSTYLNINPLNEFVVINDRIRNNLGFWHVNVFGQLFASMIGILFILHKKRISIKLLILIYLIGLLGFIITNTRSTIIPIGLFTIYYFFHNKDSFKKLVSFIKPILVSCIILSFLSPFILIGIEKSEIFYVLNELTSQRLIIAYNNFSFGEESTFSLLFGSFDIAKIDYLYLNLFKLWGVLLYLFIIFCTIKLVIKTKNISIIFFIVLYLSIGFFESYYSSGNILSLLFLFFIFTPNKDIERYNISPIINLKK